MRRLTLLAIALAVTTGCSSQEVATEAAETAAAIRPAATPPPSRDPDLNVSRDAMFGTLARAGLDPTTRPTTRLAAGMLEALPEEPRDHFVLSLDEEAMIAFEFSSVDKAKRMEMNYGTGFRYRNWYFGGLVTVDLTNKMKRALRV